MYRCLLGVTVLALSLAGCGKKPTDMVTFVEDDDPQMNAAMDKARTTVGTFLAALQAPKPGQGAFSVKVAFTDGTNTEHMWLAPVSYDGQNFQGTVNNTPQKVKNVKMGDKVKVEPSQKISDWMYVENRRLRGGETLRVLRRRCPRPVRVDFDKSVPFVDPVETPSSKPLPM